MTNNEKDKQRGSISTVLLHILQKYLHSNKQSDVEILMSRKYEIVKTQCRVFHGIEHGVKYVQ